MELAKQIKRYRTSLNLSQEEFAEKIYVTRQTISNWENEKNYPDIHSILRMATLFDISVDKLIKGDITMMRTEVDKADLRKFKKSSTIFSVMLVGAVLTFYPLVHFLNMVGMALWGVLMVVTLILAFAVEKQKKQHDIQTYREIGAFFDGVTLDEIEKDREMTKRPYQEVLKVVGSVVVTSIAIILFWLLFKALGI